MEAREAIARQPGRAGGERAVMASLNLSCSRNYVAIDLANPLNT